MRHRAHVVPVLAAAVLLLSGVLAPATARPVPRSQEPGLARRAPHGLVVFSSGYILNFPDVDNPSQVFSVPSDGDGVRQLTHVPDGSQAGAPDLSYDAKRIVYVSNVDGDFAVWTMRADGSHHRRLFGRHGYDFLQPRWSRSGKRLVVTRCNDSFGFVTECDLVVAHADGSHRRKVVGGHRINGNATFSPNGRWIAFDSDRGGYQSAVYKVRASGGRLHRLTRPVLQAFWPNWSPDGRRLVFSDNCCTPGSNVYTMRADGSHVRRLTHVSKPGAGGPAFASYAPGGNRIVYTSDQLRGPDFARTDLFVMRTDGSHQHRLVRGQPNAIGPDWERR